MMYRTRPVTVDAVQFTGQLAGRATDIIAWAATPLVSAYKDADGEAAGILIQSAEGVQIAGMGNWLVRSPDGSIVVRDAGTFARDYEPAS